MAKEVPLTHSQIPATTWDPRALFKQLLEFVRKPDFGQLNAKIAQHAAGNLMLIVEGVVFEHLADGFAFLRGDAIAADTIAAATQVAH